MAEQMRISVNGDEKVGWIIDIHDGDRQGVYSPEGSTAMDAITAAMKQHDGGDKPAPTIQPRPTPSPGMVQHPITQGPATSIPQRPIVQGTSAVAGTKSD